MLADRSYMRGDYQRRRTSALVWIIAVTVAAFVIELVVGSPWFVHGEALLSELPLTIPALREGHVWTLLTHGLIHSTSTPFHILFTVLSLIFIGRELEPLLGAKRFVGLYVGALLLGALTWSAVHWIHGGVLIGATAGIFGLFVVLALLHPYQEINFLVMFLIPVRTKPIYLVYGLLALDVFGLLFYEFRGSSPPFGYAASAHLGGMLAGWLYLKLFHASHGMDRAASFSLQLPAWLKRREKKATFEIPVATKPTKPSPNLRAEVDRILDKINSEGFGSLTEQEKRVLDDAKDMLSRS